MVKLKYFVIAALVASAACAPRQTTARNSLEVTVQDSAQIHMTESQRRQFCDFVYDIGSDSYICQLPKEN